MWTLCSHFCQTWMAGRLAMNFDLVTFKGVFFKWQVSAKYNVMNNFKIIYF